MKITFIPSCPCGCCLNNFRCFLNRSFLSSFIDYFIVDDNLITVSFSSSTLSVHSIIIMSYLRQVDLASSVFDVDSLILSLSVELSLNP